MYTEKRFCELTTKAINDAVDSEEQCGCSEADFELEPASLARITALSETLGVARGLLFDELLRCALGDAHDGFLSAYTDTTKREQANNRLKARVKALL